MWDWLSAPSHIAKMTQRLLLLDGGTWMNYWPCFIQEIRSMVEVIDFDSDTPILYIRDSFFNDQFPQGLWRQPRDHQDPEILDEFRTAYHKLKDAAIVAQNKIIRGLLYCPEFKVTPSFVYLAKFCQFTHIYPHDFSRIPGTTDVISTMKSLRHILTLSNDDDRIMATRRLDLNAWFQDGEDMSPCTHNHDEWRNQEIWLALQSLKSILNVHTRSL